MTAPAVCPFSGVGPVARGCRGTPRTVLRVTAPNTVTANRRDRSMWSSRSGSVGIARHQYSEDWMTAHVREGQVDAVRGGIDPDRVRLRRPVPAELHEGAVPLPEHRHDPGLGGHVQPPQGWVECEDIGIAPDWQYLTQLERPEIQHAERPALLTRDERQTVRGVDIDAMGVPDRRVERDATNDGGGRRIDDRQVVRGLDSDDHAMRAGVVLRVSRIAVELDPRHDSIRRCIEHKVPPP